MFKLDRFSSRQIRNAKHWGMELLVVTAGVLLALLSQAWFEGKREQARVQSAELAIRDELRHNLGTLAIISSLNQCHFEQIMHIRSQLLSGDSAWPGIPPDPAFGPLERAEADYPFLMLPLYEVKTEVWDAALQSDVLNPMDRERFNLYVNAYSVIRMFDRAEDRMQAAQQEISGLEYPARLSDDMRIEAQRDLNALGGGRGILSRLSEYIKVIEPLELESSEDLEEMFVIWGSVMDSEETIGACYKPPSNPLTDPADQTQTGG